MTMCFFIITFVIVYAYTLRAYGKIKTIVIAVHCIVFVMDLSIIIFRHFFLLAIIRVYQTNFNEKQLRMHQHRQRIIVNSNKDM